MWLKTLLSLFGSSGRYIARPLPPEIKKRASALYQRYRVCNNCGESESRGHPTIEVLPTGAIRGLECIACGSRDVSGERATFHVQYANPRYFNQFISIKFREVFGAKEYPEEDKFHN